MREKLIQIALLIIIVLLILKGCEIKNDRDSLLTQISTFKLSDSDFKFRIAKDSSTIAFQNQTILTQGDAIKLGLLKLDGEIKKVQSQVNQVQDIVIDNAPIPYVPDGYADTTGWYSKFRNGDTSKAICDSFIANSILVPTKFGLNDKWYSINGKVKKDGLLLDSLKITNESSVTIGYENYGFLNLKSKPIVEIKNSNPYLKVSKMNNVVVKKNKTILQSKLFWMGLGVLGGFYINNQLK